jgi:very-short-patch-repair endonuclease
LGTATVLKRKKPLVRRSSLKRTGMRRSAQKAGAGTDRTSHAPDAEDKLWSVLRDRDVAGLRFRRRELVGPYIVDFLCPAAKLILLVEGTAPIDPEQTQWFRDHGYRVLPFAQADILSDPKRVLDAIARAFEFKVVSRNN